MQSKLKELKPKLKEILSHKEGYIAWILANVVTSLHWVILFTIGFITGNHDFYKWAVAAYAIGFSPFVPLWLFNIFLTIWFFKLMTKKKPQKV